MCIMYLITKMILEISNNTITAPPIINHMELIFTLLESSPLVSLKNDTIIICFFYKTQDIAYTLHTNIQR